MAAVNSVPTVAPLSFKTPEELAGAFTTNLLSGDLAFVISLNHHYYLSLESAAAPDWPPFPPVPPNFLPHVIPTRTGIGRWLLLEDETSVTPTPPPSVTDYIIVGLGTSGATLAKFLSDPVGGTFPRSVLVIEAGANLSTDPGVLRGAPLGDGSASTDPRRAFAYWSDPGPNVGDGFTPFPQSTGRMWGGSSGHNTLLAVRGTPGVYNNWEAAAPGNSWAYSDLLPLMKVLENFHPNASTTPDPAERGLNGYLDITQSFASTLVPPVDVNGVTLLNAMAAGTNDPPYNPGFDYNDGAAGRVGVGAAQWYVTPPVPGHRVWSASAFMGINVVTPNGVGVGGRRLNIISSATVVDLIIQLTAAGPKCVGVNYFFNNNPDVVLQAFATKEVILCGGTVVDPGILERSGIGDPAVLGPLGIQVIVNNPNVGAHLQSHATIASAIPMGAPVIPFNFYDDYFDLSGAAPHANGQPNDGVRRANTLGFFGAGFATTLPPPLAAAIPSAKNNISMVSFLLTPKSRGSVHIVRSDALTSPKILHNLLVDPSDQADAIRLMKCIANISLAYTGNMPLWPFASHYPAGPVPNYGANGGMAPDDSTLLKDAESSITHADHIVGTCAMGASIATGVVDNNLRVFGVTGLGVCSNSVLPNITDGNTAYPAYVVGMKKAQIEGAVVA